jgi:hypothetical protein
MTLSESHPKYKTYLKLRNDLIDHIFKQTMLPLSRELVTELESHIIKSFGDKPPIIFPAPPLTTSPAYETLQTLKKTTHQFISSDSPESF